MHEYCVYLSITHHSCKQGNPASTRTTETRAIKCMLNAQSTLPATRPDATKQFCRVVSGRVWRCELSTTVVLVLVKSFKQRAVDYKTNATYGRLISAAYNTTGAI